jgi:hypothetical protein
MASNIFSSTLYTKLGLPHATICGFFICICGQPIDLIRIHLLRCVHGGNTLPHMIQFEIFSHLLLRMSSFVSWMNKLMFSWRHLSNPYSDKWILCLQ